MLNIYIRPTVILASEVNEDAAKSKGEGEKSENIDTDKEILNSTPICMVLKLNITNYSMYSNK
jgi:hypothetical protein